MISEQDILRKVKARMRQEFESVQQAREAAPGVVWDALFDLACAPKDWTPENIELLVQAPLPEEPTAALCVLMRLTVFTKEDHEKLIEKFLHFAAQYPLEGIKAAAAVLKLGPKYPHDQRLVAFAQQHYDLDPEEAWWVFVYVSRLGPRLLTRELLDWLDEKHAEGGKHWFEILAGKISEDKWAASRYLETFPGNPAAAIEAASQCLRGEPVIPLVKEYFDTNPEKAWEFYRNTAREDTEHFPEGDLDFLESRISDTADAMFEILGALAGREDTSSDVLKRFARLIKVHPDVGIDRAYYVFINNPEYLDQGVLDAVCSHFKEAAYHAFDILSIALSDRTELVRRVHVEQAFEAIPLAANWAFTFFKRLLKFRPEEGRTCVLALFECLGCEPPNRASNRSEMVRELTNIASASHIETELSKLLSEPPSFGSRRSRGLMAILFRQQLHAKQAVMIDALRLAATACTRGDQNRTPLWDFLRLLLDESGEDAVSTAAAESLLESFYQLFYLSETGAEYNEMLGRFNVVETAPGEWPEGFAILNREEELCRLYGIVRELADRHKDKLNLPPLDKFSNRVKQARKEKEFLEKKPAGKKQKQIETRIANLTASIKEWSRPEILRLMNGEPADLPEQALRLHNKNIRTLKKDLTNCLRAELRRLSVDTIQSVQSELYKNRLTAILGKEPSMDKVNPSILPVLLFFPQLDGYPNNRKWLARLVEDRIEEREPDWLWSESEPAAWAEKMKEAVPGIKLENWRSSFEKSYTYVPENAAAEKKQRLKSDLVQTRELLKEAGAEDVSASDPDELSGILEALITPAEDDMERQPPPDELVQEIRINLERIRNLIDSPESDYEGELKFEIETDPFEILFMGEYGFASCLSLRGINTWSAVSNAIDIDKAIVWARDPGGNVVGRRLLALTPGGLLGYRTYTNNHGLALNPMFKDFIQSLADHIGVKITKRGNPGPLLSDQWYNDQPYY